ncbi:Retinol dehydrogenase 12 [Armadillidium vulgare]|nr:Retinol dehydrogenase 12 [Armadillidium vulgare]
MADSDDNDWIAWGIPVIIIGFLLIVLCCLLILRWYVRRPMYKGKARIDGKTVVITGGNTGIGKETARELAKRGGKVVILCRNVVKGNVAAEEIQRETNSPVDVYELDLTDLQSIRKCAEDLKETQPKIDILINNAEYGNLLLFTGVMMTPKLETKDGLEMQIGTNHFGHFLLTLLLLNNIKAAPPSRIINVSSLAHEQGKMRWHDIHWKKKYSSIGAYSQSKLANVLFTKSLGEKLKGTGVTTYALHPGVVSTELTRHIKSTFGSCFNFLMNFIMRFFSKTPLQGAQTSIYCAVDEALQMETGKYYSGL